MPTAAALDADAPRPPRPAPPRFCLGLDAMICGMRQGRAFLAHMRDSVAYLVERLVDVHAAPSGKRGLNYEEMVARKNASNKNEGKCRCSDAAALSGIISHLAFPPWNLAYHQ